LRDSPGENDYTHFRYVYLYSLASFLSISRVRLELALPESPSKLLSPVLQNIVERSKVNINISLKFGNLSRNLKNLPDAQKRQVGSRMDAA
jgi:hypothetical protein